MLSLPTGGEPAERRAEADRRRAADLQDSVPAESRRGLDPARRHWRSFAVIVGTFVLLLMIGLGASWLAIETVNTTRAYATGEGRYSKAEKIAVLDLHRYAYSGKDSDYADFLAAIAVPRGDFVGRTALEQHPPDLPTARAGMLLGENHPDDVEGIIRLFLWFGWWKPFAAAVDDWREGDRLVAELLDRGGTLVARLTAGSLDDASRSQLLSAIDGIDNRLTERENNFSSHMGEAARAATKLVIMTLGGTTILLWVIGIGFVSRLFRQQLALDRRLGSSEQRFRDYAEVASDWYWELDGELHLTYFSSRFFAATGTSPHEMRARKAADFIRAHSDGSDIRHYLDSIAEHRPFRGLVLRFAKDGIVSFWSLAGQPRRDARGGFLGYRGVGIDITAAVRDTRMLREAKERAEMASKTKSEFLANMSHELRTPLNAILGFSELIAKRHFGPMAIDRYCGYASDIHQSARHLLSIIEDILDVSKIEAGHAELYEGDITLCALVTAAQTLLGDRFAQAGLALAIELPTPMPVVRGDDRKLTQILVNLLSNAIKFTPSGGTVTISAAIEADGALSLIVRDNGIGIAADQFQTVLAPFGQVESSFKRKHQGTGLGLPLAKALIELHGGTLALHSVLGAGTDVMLRLPADRVVSPLPPESALPPA